MDLSDGNLKKRDRYRMIPLIKKHSKEILNAPNNRNKELFFGRKLIVAGDKGVAFEADTLIEGIV